MGEVMLEPAHLKRVESDGGIRKYLESVRNEYLCRTDISDGTEIHFDINSNRISVICQSTSDNRLGSISEGIKVVSDIARKLMLDNVASTGKIKFPQVKKIGVMEIKNSNDY
jgi:hypothetical protein